MRLVRAAAANLVLLVLLAGVPAALAVTVGNPLHAWEEVRAGDVSDTVLLSVLAAVAYLAWAQFALATLLELIAALRHRPAVRVPGLGGHQHLAKTLVTAALLIAPTVGSLLVPQPASAAAGLHRPDVTVSAVHQVSTGDQAPPGITAEPPTRWLTVTADGPHTLWDIAAQELGNGQRWTEIWTMNQGRTQADGAVMSTAGLLRPGWTLQVPAAPTPPAANASNTQLTAPDAAPAPTVVTVQAGDDLAGIAEQHHLDSWQPLWEANKDRVESDGAHFTDPDLIRPGWTLDVPAAPDAEPGPSEVTVQAGDDLARIAEQHHLDSWQPLWEANKDRVESDGAHFTDPDLIRPGWTLSVPPAAPQATHDATPTPAPLAVPATPAPDAPTKPATPTPATPAPAAAQAVPAIPSSEPATPPAQQVAPAPVAPSSMAPAGSGPMLKAQDAPRAPGSAPTPLHAAHPDVAAAAAGDADDPDSQTPPFAAFAGGGVLLAGVSLAALLRYRRRQFRFRRPGRSISTTPADLVATEKRLLAAGAPGLLDVTWLDECLRGLVHAVRQQPDASLPDVLAVRMRGDVLELVLAEPLATAPAPWLVSIDALRWSITRDETSLYDPAAREYHFAPYPTLVSVGYTDTGDQWLLDLERIAALSLTGDPQRCLNLARFLAAELAHNTWSETLQVTLVGFGQEMADLNPSRLRYVEDLADAVAILDVHRRESAEVTDSTGVSALRGRLHDTYADVWSPQVLLVAPSAAGDSAAVAQLLLAVRAQRSRTAIALVLTDEPGGTSDARWQLHLDAGGGLRIPELDLYLQAQQIPQEEAAQLAQLLAMAADVDDRPSAPAHSHQPWDAYADATGALILDADRTSGALNTEEPEQGAARRPATGAAAPAAPISAAVRSAQVPWQVDSVLPLPVETYVQRAATSTEEIRALAPLVPAAVRIKVESADPQLDEDLADWAAPDCVRPKVAVLGPIEVTAQHPLPQKAGRTGTVSREFYSEVIAYFAAHPDGVSSERYGSDLWPHDPNIRGKNIVRNSISAARLWLGSNPRTGRSFLVNEATPGARGFYKTEDMLFDAELFRRLRARGTARGRDGLPDLQAALELVRGVPFDRRRVAGYSWLVDVPLDHEYEAMVVDVAHLVATHHLGNQDPHRAAAAAQVALRAGSLADQPLLDLIAACTARGDTAQARHYVDQILSNRDAELIEDLPPETSKVLIRQGWLYNAS